MEGCSRDRERNNLINKYQLVLNEQIQFPHTDHDELSTGCQATGHPDSSDSSDTPERAGDAVFIT